jgi:hypothetical protein
MKNALRFVLALGLAALIYPAPGSAVAGDSPLMLQPGNYYSFAFNGVAFAYADLEKINVANGVGTYIWSLDYDSTPPPGALAYSPFGLTFDVDGTMYATMNVAAFDPAGARSQLARIDSNTGEVTLIGAPVPFNTAGPDIDAQGNMYVCGFQVDALGYIWGNSNLYRIDKATGEFISVGDTGHTHWMDLAFDSQGTLWGTFGNELYTIDTQTGASTFVTAIYGVPDAGDPRFMEVMSIAFDAHDVLYGTAMTVYYDDPQGSPVVRIDTTTGECEVKGYTHQVYNHGGDILPSKARVAHLDENGAFSCIDVGMTSVGAHLAHGDYVPGGAGQPGNCP